MKFTKYLTETKKIDEIENVITILDKGPSGLLKRIHNITADKQLTASELEKGITEDAVVGIISSFASDSDIRDFYAEYKTEIDDELTTDGFFEKTPESYGAWSLDSIVEYGTATVIIKWSKIISTAIRSL